MTMPAPRYDVLIEPVARRALGKLPRDVQARLMARIEALSINPRPSGVVKLSGHEAYRIRVGDYRVIYAMVDDRLLVLVVDVGNRRDVYRGW
jgi:mRNA interferase RelE/StbE